MDLDRFKLVNDAWGHHVGDNLLVSVANRMSACLTPKMTLARIGGDEFILLAPTAMKLKLPILHSHGRASVGRFTILAKSCRYP
jgi:diguanylate cyclase (GGDEF)-like protein